MPLDWFRVEVFGQAYTTNRSLRMGHPWKAGRLSTACQTTTSSWAREGERTLVPRGQGTEIQEQLQRFGSSCTPRPLRPRTTDRELRELRSLANIIELFMATMHALRTTCTPLYFDETEDWTVFDRSGTQIFDACNFSSLVGQSHAQISPAIYTFCLADLQSSTTN